jgi:hypothetical protein
MFCMCGATSSILHHPATQRPQHATAVEVALRPLQNRLPRVTNATHHTGCAGTQQAAN